MIRILLNGTAYPEDYLSWQEVTDVITRSEKYHGVMQTTTLEIQLIKDAYDYVDGLDNTFDIAAECTFVRQSHDDNINGWTDDFSGYLDFTTLKRDNQGSTKKLTINAYSDNFSNKLIERQEIEIPYDRLEDLDGGTITPFANEYIEVDVEGIEVVGDDVPTIIDENKYSSDGTERNVIFGLTTDAKNTALKTVAAREYGSSKQASGMNIGDCYYLAPSNSTLTIDYTIYYDFGSDLSTQPNDWEAYINIYKAVFDDDYNLVSYTIQETVVHYDEALDQTFSGTFSIDLVENEAIIFYAYHWAQNIFVNEGSYLNIKENSLITTTYSELDPPTPCNFVPPFEFGTRIIQSITGQTNGLDSPILGRTDSPTTYDEDGIGSMYFCTNGKLVRQFPTGYKTTDDNKKAQLSSSFADWFDSLDKVLCLGAGVKYESGQYKLLVDDRKEFYKNEVVYTVSLSEMEVNTFEVEKNLELYYNEVNVGSTYEQPEEVSGLEEYNSPQSYSSPILNENILDLLNRWIYAAYPFEFARRKPYTDQETEDYKYDNNNFIFNVERDGVGGYQQLQDTDFDDISGLENISTYLNLNLTPSRLLKRFYWWINTGLRGFQAKYLKFNTSENVTDLSTRKTGEANNIVENDDKLISTFESPKFTGNIVRFNAPVKNFATLQANPYGLIEYTNPLTDTLSYGYIREISTSKIDKGTNFELWETTGFSEEGNFRLLQDGSYRLLEDGNKRLLED